MGIARSSRFRSAKRARSTPMPPRRRRGRRARKPRPSGSIGRTRRWWTSRATPAGAASPKARVRIPISARSWQRRGLTAGVDMDMQSSIYVDSLAALVRSNRIPIRVVDSAVMRILRAKQRLGLFRDPYRARTAPANPELRAIARRVAGESIVLLKNEPAGRGAACCAPTLPLAKSGTIAVIGPLADNKEEPIGPWHTQGRAEDVVSVLQGIKTKVPTVLYAQGSGIDDTSKAGFAAAVAAARQAKVAVLVLGERGDMSGEAASRSSLGLPGVQEQLLEPVAATGTPVVLVLINGRPLILECASDHLPAIV